MAELNTAANAAANGKNKSNGNGNDTGSDTNYRRDTMFLVVLALIVGGMIAVTHTLTGVTPVGYVLHGAIILGAIVAVAKGAAWLVEAAVRIANSMGVSTVVIGLTVVAFGTSAPEFAVSLSAGLQKHGSVAIANIVGSNVFNLGFILGGVALLTPVVVARRVVFRDGFFLIASTLVLFFFLWDLYLQWYEGLILFVSLFVYMGILLFGRKEKTVPATPTADGKPAATPDEKPAAEPEAEPGHGHIDGLELTTRVMFPSNRHVGVEPPEDIELEDIPKDKATWLDFPIFLVGLAVTIVGCHFMVESAIWYAKAMHVSTYAIGVTIIAAGTSAPEMAVSLVAALKGHHDISAGNLIGSDLFNVMGVLGLAAILNVGITGESLTIDPAKEPPVAVSPESPDVAANAPSKPSDKTAPPAATNGNGEPPKSASPVESQDIQMPNDKQPVVKDAPEPAKEQPLFPNWGLAPGQWSVIALIGMVCLTVFFMWTGFKVNRLEGGILFGIAILRWIIELVFVNPGV